MTDFPKFEYSNNQVVKAGEALAGELVWTDESADRIREVFKIANNWRDSHALPMRRIRQSLMGCIRSAKVSGITAARLKRMRSIRKKLTKISSKLNQIQDLAGCRAIVPDMGAVTAVVTKLRESSGHKLHNEIDYINKPKPDGYRCHHMVFRFEGDGEERILNGRRVEVQVRTRLQHSWATAVEAVGTFRREDMKAGKGSPEWLRLFKLMSVEFALEEGCLIESDADRKSRRGEIFELEKKLDAVAGLENLRQAVRYTENYVQGERIAADYYLIKYNNSDNSVQVERYSSIAKGVSSYDNAEASDNASGNNSVNTVLVEIDKVENLIDAYPNYFGDVQLFKSKLQALVGEGKEFALLPQQTVPPKKREVPDLSWFKKRKRWE